MYDLMIAYCMPSRVVVCCSMLQYVALCCSVLQYVALCCSVMHNLMIAYCVPSRVAVCCSVLQCVALCCIMLQCDARLDDCILRAFTCCSMLHYVAVCCSVMYDLMIAYCVPSREPICSMHNLLVFFAQFSPVKRDKTFLFSWNMGLFFFSCSMKREKI